MSIIDNKEHFLREHLTFLESYGKEGKNGGFTQLLEHLGIKTGGQSWNEDHSTIDWTKADNHFQFFFDFENSQDRVREWLNNSVLRQNDTLLTWLSYEDPIIRIKTKDFIENWEEFNVAAGWDGLILTTEDGKYFMEFTDDWKYNLNSNFQIKPSSEKITT